MNSFYHSTSEEVVHRFLGEIQIRAIVCRYFHIQMLKQKTRERHDSVTITSSVIFQTSPCVQLQFSRNKILRSLVKVRIEVKPRMMLF